VDWVVLVLVLLSAVNGFVRGLLTQLVGAVGLLVGIWAAAVFSQWVGVRWADAQPAVVFWAIKWVLVVLVALAIYSVFHVTGEASAQVVRRTPLGWLDRGSGLLAGAVLCLAMASFGVLLAMSVPAPRAFTTSVASARSARPLLAAGAKMCSYAPWIPGAHGLRARFLTAERRTTRPSRAV